MDGSSEGETLLRRFRLPKSEKWTTLSVKASFIRLCCRTVSEVFVYTMEGDFKHRIPMPGVVKSRIYICDDDEEGAMLIVDPEKNALRVMLLDGSLSDVRLNAEVRGPISACLVNDQLFVFSKDERKLIVFR